MGLSIRSTDTEERKNWSSVYAVALSTFAVVTTEMLPVGFISLIAYDLNISVGTSGLVISAPAILAAFFAPFVILMAGNVDRRRVLAGLLVLLTFANLASATAPSIGWLIAARVIVGFCMGGIWAIAGGLAPRLVPTHSIGTATSIIFAGVAAASVLGVPLGAMIGDIAGWRWAFCVAGIFSIFVLSLVLLSVPALPVSHSVKVGEFLDSLDHPAVLIGLILTILIVAGHFMAFIFIGPILQSVSGISSKWISALLFIYGLAGVIGNFLAGAMVARWTGLMLGLIALTVAAAIMGFVLIGGTPIGGIGLLILWGLAYGGVSVTLQTWMMKASPSTVETTTALFVSMFNIGIATGSFLGSQAVNHVGLQQNLLIAAVLPALALLLILTISRRS